MKTINLPEEYAVVLQEVSETGEEDISLLEESLRFDHGRLMHILQNLRHKGLIYFSQDSYRDPLIRLSSKGKRMMNYMWPEARPHYAY